MDTNTLLIILVVIFLLSFRLLWPGPLVLNRATLNSSDETSRRAPMLIFAEFAGRVVTRTWPGRTKSKGSALVQAAVAGRQF